ncbi:type II toxin-antitoxin system Phd/YefM family antitoxin [Candidatus Daviesbacteria bacterium]|nr:type II toxin-antitoxin system Phd/YefM family antitoxin [Candidatus Daviesbacteria bacterium]
MTNILPISDVRENLPSLVDKVDKRDDRVIITVNGKPKAVMVNFEELEALEETAEILSIPGALESIKRGTKEARAGKGITLSELK